MSNDRVAKQTFEDLTRSLYAGSVRLDETKVELLNDVVQDEAYHRYSVSQAATLHDIHTELSLRFKRVWVDNVIVWE